MHACRDICVERIAGLVHPASLAAFQHRPLPSGPGGSTAFVAAPVSQGGDIVRAWGHQGPRSSLVVVPLPLALQCAFTLTGSNPAVGCSYACMLVVVRELQALFPALLSAGDCCGQVIAYYVVTCSCAMAASLSLHISGYIAVMLHLFAGFPPCIGPAAHAVQSLATTAYCCR